MHDLLCPLLSRILFDATYLTLGSPSIEVGEEIRRVVPLVEAVRKRDDLKSILISIDTTKSAVAEAAIDAGANIINDVSSGTRDPEMINVLTSSLHRVPRKIIDNICAGGSQASCSHVFHALKRNSRDDELLD